MAGALASGEASLKETVFVPVCVRVFLKVVTTESVLVCGFRPTGLAKFRFIPDSEIVILDLAFGDDFFEQDRSWVNFL